MKPEKITNMMLFILFYMTLFSYVVIVFSYNSIVKLVMGKGISFIFPTFIFVSFWRIQLKSKKEKISLRKFYLYVFLNIILPYLICLIPYMIYESNKDFLSAIISGNNMPHFLYFKIMIELLVIYPLVEYGIKKNAKFFIIGLLVLTIIFNLFNLSKYLMIEVFEYIIFAAIGICFAEYEKKANRFLRSNKDKILNSVVESSILMYFTTIFKMYGFLNPAITTFYSLATMLGICYICYRYKFYYSELRSLGRGVILDFFTRNPLIIFSAVALLHPLILKILYSYLKTLSTHTINCIVLLTAVLCCIVSKKLIDVYYIKHKKELYLKKQRW